MTDDPRRLAVFNPPPVRKIPILVAGAGERKTLALAARHADIWNALLPDAESYARKSRLLDEHCARIGRDPGAIERSVLVAGPPEHLGEQHAAPKACDLPRPLRVPLLSSGRRTI